MLPYLWGLLPEDPAARRHVAADAGVSPNNPFALLGVIGLDCPGAVQFVPQDSDAYRDERLVAVSGAEIARRLAMGRHQGSSGDGRGSVRCFEALLRPIPFPGIREALVNFKATRMTKHLSG